MSKNIDEFLRTIKKSNIKPSYYYTDYQRVAEHIENFKDVINKFGAVHSSKEFKEKFSKIYNDNPKAIEIIPLFTGVRPNKFIVLNEKEKWVNKFDHKSVTKEEALEFLDEVGFLEKLDENNFLDLPSYFFGVNVGLDSNTRKNRSGKQMEMLVGSYVKPVFDPEDFIEHAKLKKVNDKFGTSFKWKKNIKDKEIDFVIRANGKYYFIETNFFNTSGSKTDINTRFIQLNKDILDLDDNTVFMLITDGTGLTKAKNELEDVINNIEHTYNIDDLENGLMEKIKSK